MTWKEFRELPLIAQSDIMDHYEDWIKECIKNLRDNFYMSSEQYKREEKIINNRSLNDYLDTLKQCVSCNHWFEEKDGIETEHDGFWCDDDYRDGYGK